MSTSKTAGQILRTARLKKGLTQVEVGKKAGLGKNTYPKIERGVSRPSPESIKELIRVLDIESAKIPYLLG